MISGADRLDLLKTLGDNTRYAIYLEIARSPRPLATSEIADTLGLHPNTVRPHLERMREVGLLEVSIAACGGVGRPQHRYATSPEAPALGLEPPLFRRLAGWLVRLAAEAGVDGDAAAAIGRDEGTEVARRRLPAGESPAAAVLALHAEFGFDPAGSGGVDGQPTTVAFTHCPFDDLAGSHPEIVCSLHRGLVEGFVEECGGTIDQFRDLADRTPCRVELGDTDTMHTITTRRIAT